MSLLRLKKKIESVLTPIGFVSEGLTWNRRTDGIVQVLQLQHDSSAKDSAAVTINLGLCDSDVWFLTWDKDRPSIFDETDCCPRFRVGFLLNEEKLPYLDKWWSLSVNDDGVESEIIAIIADLCVPYLNAYDNRLAMQSLAVKLIKKAAIGDKLLLAVLSHVLGKFSERDALFEELLSARSKSWHGKIVDIQNRLRLA